MYKGLTPQEIKVIYRKEVYGISKNRFIKIQNDFFYSEGKKLKDIGGIDAFLMYCLFTIRKDINNNTYITKGEINNILGIDGNATRSRSKIDRYLIRLRDEDLISFDDEIIHKNNTTFIKIHWIDHFKNGECGWIAFYQDDFRLIEEKIISNQTYVLIWLIRMHKNKHTNTSFLSITAMSKILNLGRDTIYESMNILKKLGIIRVFNSDRYYYNEDYGKVIKKNNEYMVK